MSLDILSLEELSIQQSSRPDLWLQPSATRLEELIPLMFIQINYIYFKIYLKRHSFKWKNSLELSFLLGFLSDTKDKLGNT